MRSPRRRSRTGGCWRRRERRSSTSAASRPGRGPRRCRTTRSCGGSSRWSRRWPRTGSGRSPSTPRRQRSRRRRSTPGRRSSTTSPPCAAIPRWRRSAPTAAPPSSSCTCWARRGRCRTTPATRTWSARSAPSSKSGWRRPRRPGSTASGSGSIPGIGFGKTDAHNNELLRRLGELAALGRPLVVGTSRKSFIGRLDGSAPGDRLGGSVASSVIAAANGATVLRVHDVAEVHQALAVAEAVLG